MSAAVARADATVRRFLDAAVGGDREHARRIGLDEAARTGPVATIERLLTPALRLAGDRWLEASLPDHGEHRVTSTVDAVLDALDPLVPLPSDGPHVAVTTGDDDWHGTAARVAALLLRERGWRTRYAGPAMTAERLDDLLGRVDLDVLALSCPVPSHLAGAGRTVMVAHARGLPVVVGGGAFDAHPGRAAMIGADAGPGTLPPPGGDLQAWVGGVRAAGLAAPGRVVAAALELDQVALLHGVLDDFGPQGPFGARQLRDDVVRTSVDAWLSAVAVDDAELLAEQLAWVRAYLRARSLPGALLVELASVLHRRVPIDPGGQLARAAGG